jgi:O-antigen/teichoic acid export membrane protein
MITGNEAENGSSSAVSIVRSVSWNYAGYFCEFLAGVFLLAYVVRRISVADYGIFLLALSLAGFLHILDFGLGNVLVQLYMSVWSSTGIREASRLASSLVLTLFVGGLLGATVLSALAWAVPQLLKLPSAQTAVAVRVLVLVAFSAAPAMAAMPLEHFCQAFHRFDRLNQVQIAMVALRVAFTVAVLATRQGIVGLAAIQAALTTIRLLMFLVVTRAAVAGFAFTPLQFDGGAVAGAMKASRWAFGDDVARRLANSSEPAILAGLSSLPQVAMFGVAGKLPAHIYTFAVRGLSVLMPSFSRQYNEGDTEQLRESYCNAFRVCVTGLLPLVIFAAICSRQLLAIWAGPAYRDAAPAMVALLLFVLSQVVEIPSDLVLYSHGRIRRAARLSMIESGAKIALVLALVVPYGAAGVAAGAALAHWSVNLFGYMPQACRVAHLRPRELWRRALSGYGSRQAALFGTMAAALSVGSRTLPPSAVFAGCAAACLIYAGVWLAYTARPMWKAEVRKLPALVM